MSPALEVKPEWLRLLQDFPERFVIGGDQFIPSPMTRGTGPGLVFAGHAEQIRAFLDALPPDLARRISHDNALRLYRFRD